MPNKPNKDDSMTNKCNHQWFEVRKTTKHLCDSDHIDEDGMKNICFSLQDGVIVQCANCEKVKTLWGEPNDE